MTCAGRVAPSRLQRAAESVCVCHTLHLGEESVQRVGRLSHAASTAVCAAAGGLAARVGRLSLPTLGWRTCVS